VVNGESDTNQLDRRGAVNQINDKTTYSAIYLRQFELTTENA